MGAREIRSLLSHSLNEEYKVSKELNPKLWDGISLKKDVAEKLEELVHYFTEFLKEKELPIHVLDAWIVGSNASFNYTDHSDLDLHIIVDTSIADCGAEFLLMAYNAYRSLFNDNYDITINGVPVEVYVEDVNSSITSNGIYSLSKGWLKEPEYKLPPEIATDELDNEYAMRFRSVMENPTLTSVEDLINDIYLLRKEGISVGGEYSVNNQVFKNFRDAGYLQQLKDKRKELISQRLSK